MNKEKRFLITTALEETWVVDQPVLFLGEWCKLYSRRDHWTKMDTAVQPYHWDDREKLCADYQYLNGLYERFLVDLSGKLNQIHGVEYSLRYWRILVGPWLAYFIHILFDRWSSVENAVNTFEISKTFAMTGNEDALIPNDMNQFAEMMVTDEWNHFIYTELLRKCDRVSIEFLDNNEDDEKDELNAKQNQVKVSLKRRMALTYATVAHHLARDNDAIISATYLPRLNELLLQLRLGQVPQFRESVKPVQHGVVWQQRGWTLSGRGNSEFEKFLLLMLPRQIPTSFLEGYQQLITQIRHLPWPKSPKLIYTSNLLWHDTVFMAYVAEKIERGSPLVCGQHGGGYGTAKFHFAEEHEVEISDRYLTWGWCDALKENIIPTGITKVVNREAAVSNKNNILLFIAMNSFRYSFRLCAESAVNYEKYIDRGFSFLQKLYQPIITKLLVRLSPFETGQCLPARWGDRFPQVEIDDGNSNIYKLLTKARIVVQTYNQTGVLETLAMRIPTILLVDLKETPLRESAIPYYIELKAVGIFHDTPESAAAHVNAIWDDVDAWWTSGEVQDVIARFTKHYCRRPYNIMESIETVLLAVVAESCDTNSLRSEFMKQREPL